VRLQSIAGFALLVEQAERGLVNAVHLARRSGYSWQDIGEALGVSRQAAWQRFAHLDRR
jgi:biotin operon repressor